MSIDDRYNNRPPMDGGYSREDRYSKEDMRMRQARPRGQAPEGSRPPGTPRPTARSMSSAREQGRQTGNRQVSPRDRYPMDSPGTGRHMGEPSGRQTGSARGASSAPRHSGGSSRPPGSRSPQSSRYYSSGSEGHYSSGQEGHSPRRSGNRRGSSPNYQLLAIAGIILVLAIGAVVYGMQHSKKTNIEPQSSENKDIEIITSETETETELEKTVSVDGIEITGMSREDAKAEILKKYPWDMKIVYQDDTYEVANLMEEKVNSLLDEIYRGEPKESYTLDTTGLEESIKAQAAAAAARWNKSAKNGSISKYDASSDKFVFEGEATGIAIDQEKLVADIQNALTSKKFDTEITVSASEVQPEISVASAKEKYKTVATYTTKTTANSKRNTNVRLAAEAVNGTIVQPGQEFSFNDTVGERTEAKGYQSAAAYNNGEVVQEIGGGVCQVSTTLYNAVLKAGLKISVRRSHTFEPSYVTPGQDATVSWGGPDFKFINNSNTAIGLRARYADQTMTVSVYAIPILEDGVTYSLESKKIADVDPPAPTYEEDQSLQPGQEVTKSSGTKGSRWETRLIVKKGDEVISREVDHTVTYKGHAPVIKRNTSGVVVSPSTEATSTAASESATETTPAESQEAPETSTSIPQGPTEQGPGQQPSVEPTASEPTIGPDRPREPSDVIGEGGPGEVVPQPEIPEGPGFEGPGNGGMIEPFPGA